MKKSIFILGISGMALLLTSFFPTRQSAKNYYYDNSQQYQDDGYYDGSQPGYDQQQGYYYRDGYQPRNDQQQVRYYRQGQQQDNYQQQGYQQQSDQNRPSQWYHDNSGSADTYQDRNQQNFQGQTDLASSDQDIAEQINGQIKPGFISKGYERVNFDVRNGNVILRGTVDTQEDKETLEKNIRAIKGVKNLDSQLVIIKQAVSQNTMKRSDDRTNLSISDEELSKKINDLIKPGYLSKGFEHINFNVRNGNVWLKGTVESLKDKEKLENSVRNINGVRNVDSQIAITTRRSE